MLELIKKFLEEGALKAIVALCKSVQSVFMYLEHKREDKKEEKYEQTVEKAEKTIDDACDKGTLDDLIDACIKYGKETGK